MASTNIFGPLDKICLKKSVVSGERDGYDDESDEDNFNVNIFSLKVYICFTIILFYTITVKLVMLLTK